MWPIRGFIIARGLIVVAAAASAQVLPPQEIPDPQLRELQQRHLADLKNIATAISAHSFPYGLYFSRTLDLSEREQKQSDQRAIRFDKFRGKTVLEITANYYASYSADLMDKEERARRTLQDVGVPILQAAIPPLAEEEKVQSFAIEISHHVRRKILGVSDENYENVALIFPVSAGKMLMAATTPGEQEAALLQGELFVNREPVEGWGLSRPQLAKETGPSMVTTAAMQDNAQSTPETELRDHGPKILPGESGKALVAVAPAPGPGQATGSRAEVSVDSLQTLQQLHQADVDRLLRELDKQAHFVSYAPPAFVSFHKGAFLQISVMTTLKENAAGSEYQMAALAFDEHIAHLIRPVLTVLKGVSDFDGFDFSTTIRLAGRTESAGVAVEFIFPASALKSYQDYDLTGQQLINMGFVLINGERVSVELQAAEAGLPVQP
jgi:hypothetical protein